MNIGDYINTPRFLKVRIEEVFITEEKARENGYYEPTHYDSENYDIYGKHTGINRMTFAAIEKARTPSQLWDMVNNAGDHKKVSEAEAAIAYSFRSPKAGLDHSEYDELIKSLAYISKELEDKRICQNCKSEVNRNDMSFTRDCQGITFRLVCYKCYDKLMAKGYDGQYYDERDECLDYDY